LYLGSPAAIAMLAILYLTCRVLGAGVPLSRISVAVAISGWVGSLAWLQGFR